MTREICSHHYYGLMWVIAEVVLSIITLYGGTVYASHDWKSPPFSIPTEQFMPWDNGIMMFYFGIGLIVFSNLFALYIANGRYAWIRIKECSRN